MKPRVTLIAAVACFICAWGALLLLQHNREVAFSPQYTLREFARLNNVKPGKVKSELGMTMLRGRTTLEELGLDRKRAAGIIAHLRGSFRPGAMAAAQAGFAAAVCLAMVLLCRRKMSSPVKYILLCIAVIGFGFALGKAFNPMVATVKVGKCIAGLEGNPAGRLLVLALFVLLAVIGNKAVCGWACPYGALQELLFKLPVLRSFKKKHKIPFRFANAVRICFFILFVAALCTDLLGFRGRGQALYHVINPFNLFELNFTLLTVALYIAATLLVSLVYYRPHCYAVCPFGLVSWLLERASIFRIRIDREKCTGCGACIKACPGQAMKGIYEQAALPPDCFSCGECLGTCPADALSYTGRPLPAVTAAPAKQ